MWYGIGALAGWDEASAQSLVQIRDQVVGILNADRRFMDDHNQTITSWSGKAF